MISAIFSFFGGSAFRMIWGEISAWWTARQEHQQELARIEAQERADAAAHQRNMESLRLQHDLGVEVIRVQGEIDTRKIEADGWLEAVKSTGRKVGVAWVDAWNAMIRPAVATWAVIMMTGNYMRLWTLDENGWAVCGAALGIYLADRALFRRGK